MSEELEAQTTLRDQLESAIEQHEAPETTPQAETRPRDEVGRFAPKETPEPKPDQAASAPPEAAAAPVVKPRPSSWKSEYEERWSKLDPTLQDYIAKREADYAKGVSTYKQNWDQAAPIYEAIQPFMPTLQQNNIDPKTWITSLGNAHQILALGSPQEKAQMFVKLATDYGVPLQSLVGQQADPQFSTLAQELNQLKNQWTQFHSSQQQQEQQLVQMEIQRFATDKPHFEAVRETMSGLLQSGVADSLQSAYDKAIRLHDDIWQQQQAEAQQAKAKAEAEAQQQRVNQAKAKAVSPRSSSPTGMMSSGNGKKGLRETLSEQLEQAMGGRV